MQERRTTVRVNRLSRAQYCPAEDLIPRDGRITNLSERGVGLLAHEVHHLGERVTVSFSIPDDEEPLTATGVVRWSDPQPYQGRWYPVGLEWLPLEDTARHRLHTFLGSYRQTIGGRTPFRRQTSLRTAQQLVIGGVLVIGLLIGVFSLSWAVSLQGDNHRLSGTIQQLSGTIQERNRMVSQLAQRGIQLEQALAASKTQLAAASEAMAQLDHQAKYFEGGVQRLSQEVDRFQQSYVQLREEREQLVQRVLDLEQERLLLSNRLSSIPDLRRAIHDAVDARRQAKRLARLKDRRQTIERDRALGGNRGYLVWDGQPTTRRSTVWIKVHDPEPLLTKP